MGVAATVTLRNKVFEALVENKSIDGFNFSEYMNQLITKDLGLDKDYVWREQLVVLLEEVLHSTSYTKHIVENESGVDTIVYRVQPRISNSIVCTIKLHKYHVSVEYAVYSRSMQVKREMEKCFKIAKPRGEFMCGLQLKHYNRRTALVWRRRVTNDMSNENLNTVAHDIKWVLNVLLYAFANYWTLD